MVPFSKAVKYRSIAACLFLIWDWRAPASACRSAWPLVIHVLPFAAGAHPAMDGPFCLLSFPEPEDPDLVYLEQATSGLVPEEPEEVRRYTLMFGTLLGKALSAEESVTFMSAITQNRT
jgi:hypothetical protein